MSLKNIDIKENELASACDYISSQFIAHSWWPCEQPSEAKREFKLMGSSAIALNVWCEKWLDTRQCQKLKNSLHL